MKLSRFLSILAVVATLLVAPVPTGNARELSTPVVAQDYGISATEWTFVELVNQDRANQGLAPLELDLELLQIARERAVRQLGEQPLSHVDETGEIGVSRMLNEAALGYRLAGENLARASRSDVAYVAPIEQALMASPTHRHNILQPAFNRVAIGEAVDPVTGQAAYAQIFRAV